MKRLETLANICVIAAAVVVLGFKGYNWLIPPARQAEPRLSKILLGKPLMMPTDSPAGLAGTVTLFVSKDCHFCSDSMDFYRHLARVRLSASCELKLVAVGPKERESEAELKAYIASHNLNVDGVGIVDFTRLGLVGTPTLVLTDRSKLVRGVWYGRLQQSSEDKVISMMRAMCAG